MEAHSEALDALRQKIIRGEVIVSVIQRKNSEVSSNHLSIQANSIEQYEVEVKERIDEYAGKTQRQKYAKDTRYVEFHNSIWVCSRAKYATVF